MASKVRIVGRGAEEIDDDVQPNSGGGSSVKSRQKTEFRVPPTAGQRWSDAQTLAMRDDIAILTAEAQALKTIGVLSASDVKRLIDVLKFVREELLASGLYAGTDSLHRIAAIMQRMQERLPTVGGVLSWVHDDIDHVSTRLRMQLRRQIGSIILGIADLQEVLVELGRHHRLTPVFIDTTGRSRTITSVAHILIGFSGLLQMDIGRMADAAESADVLPLGSGGGVPHSIAWDRKHIANALGFTAVTTNSFVATMNGDCYVEVGLAGFLLAQHALQIMNWFEGAALPAGSVRFPTGRPVHGIEHMLDHEGALPALKVEIQSHYDAMLALSGEPIPDAALMLSWERHVLGLLEATYLLISQVNRKIASMEIHIVEAPERYEDPAYFLRDVIDYLLLEHKLLGEAEEEASAAFRRLQRARALGSGEAQHVEAIPQSVVELFHRKEVLGGPGPKGMSKQVVRTTAQIARSRRLGTYIARTAKGMREVGLAAQPQKAADIREGSKSE